MNEDIQKLVEIADKNNGHCDRCNRVIKIYTYKVNAGHASTLKAMADHVKNNGDPTINFNDLDNDIRYSAATQRTKMRLHGLIAKYKEDGVHVASKWVITTKGYNFLKGDDIPEKVIVFDNQVLGHGSDMTNIKRLSGDSLTYEETPITTAEAEVYNDIRTPRKNTKYHAQFKGKTVPRFDVDKVYEIEIERLQVGSPIQLVAPFKATYKDIAEFYKYWKILKEIK